MIYLYRCEDGHVNEIELPMASQKPVAVVCSMCGKSAKRVFTVPMMTFATEGDKAREAFRGIGSSDKDFMEHLRQGDREYEKTHKNSKSFDPVTVDSIPESKMAECFAQAGLL